MKQLLLIMVIVAISCTSKKDFEKGKKQLLAQGYTDVENTGYESFCCGESDDYSTGFKAKDKFGNTVIGCFCSSYKKGLTIRFK